MTKHPSKSSLAARSAAALAALALLLVTAPVPATQIPVFIGSVGVGKARPEVQGELRAMLRAELSATDFAGVKTTERYSLSTTLVRLDSEQSSDSVRATCVISVALLRDGSSTLYAIIHGRATAEDSNKAHASVAQSDALRAAVHSALVRVPKALR